MIMFFYGVMYSGVECVYGVTPSVLSIPGKLKNLFVYGGNRTNDLWFCETNAPLTELRDQIGSSGGFSELSIVPSISASFMDMILMHMFCCFMYSGESVYCWCFCYLYFIKISLQQDVSASVTVIAIYNSLYCVYLI